MDNVRLWLQTVYRVVPVLCVSCEIEVFLLPCSEISKLLRRIREIKKFLLKSNVVQNHRRIYRYRIFVRRSKAFSQLYTIHKQIRMD